MRQNRPAKDQHRALFLALQADAKSFPGGITGIAELIGMNKVSLANCLNPDSESQPPSFGVILEIIALAQAKRTMYVLAQMVGQVAMDFELEHRTPAEAIKLFLTLVSTVSELLGTGSEAAKDGRFDAAERAELQPLLLALMKATGEFMQSLQG